MHGFLPPHDRPRWGSGPSLATGHIQDVNHQLGCEMLSLSLEFRKKSLERAPSPGPPPGYPGVCALRGG